MTVPIVDKGKGEWVLNMSGSGAVLSISSSTYDILSLGTGA